MAKKLSPAAQAVWDAAWANTPVQCGDIEGTRRAQVAAALRAAADQVVPMALCVHNDDFVYVRHQFLAIANELEVQ